MGTIIGLVTIYIAGVFAARWLNLTMYHKMDLPVIIGLWILSWITVVALLVIFLVLADHEGTAWKLFKFESNWFTGKNWNDKKK